MNPTYQRLRELFYYNPDTGIVTRRVAVKGNAVGTIVGTEDKNGYTVACVDYKYIKLHRLIWCFVYGYWPEHDIDHINGQPNDNRISNLREVSRSCNLQNSRVRSDNTSGCKGVTRSASNKWRAYIHHNKKQHYLGSFDSFSEAKAHRRAAEECLGWCKGGRHADL